VGGAAASSGFAFCGSDGKIWLISADGGDAGHAELGDRVKLCTISTGPAPLAPKKLEVSLAQQLASAFEVLEPDMAVAQRFLLTELGKLKEPLVSKLLIELSSSPRLPPDQRDETRRLLAARRNGAEYMLQALERHYDFVSGVILPPPVGPLAEALSAMGEKAAAPLLARHLNDPANSPEDVLQAALALRALAGAEQFEELRTFFALYRATADSDELVKAVIAVGAALVRIGSESGRELVVRAAEDPLTHPEVRRALTALVPAPKNASADVGDRTAKPAP
jgi:outer membrane protein assembly factor BamB